VLFEAHPTKLADDQFLTALSWGIAALQDAVHQGQSRIKRGLCIALVGALELLSAADWNGLFFRPKRIRPLRIRHQRARRLPTPPGSRPGLESTQRSRLCLVLEATRWSRLRLGLATTWRSQPAIFRKFFVHVAPPAFPLNDLSTISIAPVVGWVCLG
jgi:hypothetical protein